MKQEMNGKGGRQIKCEIKARHTSSLPIPAVPFALASRKELQNVSDCMKE